MSTLTRVIFDQDTIPPSLPSNVTGTAISPTRIDLSWTASTDTGGSGLVGYLVYRAGLQIGQTTAASYSDTGLAASTQYAYQVAAIDGAGNTSSKTIAINVTTQANVGVPAYAQDQPKAALVGIAGVRTFTDPTQIAALGRYNWALLGIAGWEGWASGGRDADVPVKAIKSGSTAQGGTLVLAYSKSNVIEEDANDPFPTFTAEVVTRNWKLFSNVTTGVVNPNDGAATAVVNYSDAVPVNPSLEHPYEYAAAYLYNKFLTKTKSDGRFTALNAGLASSSFDGIYWDNLLCNPQIVGDWSRDGTVDTVGWPCSSTTAMQQGQARGMARMRSLAPTKYIVGNCGDYGVVTNAGAMAGQVDSPLAESYMGKYWSWETQKGFVTMLTYYYRELAFATNPELVVFGGSWPDTNADGTALVRLPNASGYPPAYTQEQWARYIAGTAYLGEGMAALSQVSAGYNSDLSALYWPWFYGGVNGLARGWMGKPVTALRPASPTIAKGTIGLYHVERTQGLHVVNPRGNGTQLVTNADIGGGNWQYPPGSPQGTGTFSNYLLVENDALFLQRFTPVSTFAPNEPAGLTTLADFTWNKVDSKLGTLPPTVTQLNARVTDQLGRTWGPGDGLTHAPFIDTPANLVALTGETITAPPDGALQVLAIEYPNQEASGTVPFIVYPPDNSFQVQKLYACCNVWMPADFHDAGNNIKWFNIEQGGSPNANHIAMLSAGGNGDNGDGRSVWLTIQGGGGLNNPGGVGSLGGGVKNLANPPGSGTGWWNSMRGKWVTCEWLFTQESPPGSTTGQMQSWVSWPGQAPFLVNDFRNLKFNAASGNPNCFNTWKFVPYYGGGGGSAPSTQHLFMSRFRVSGK